MSRNFYLWFINLKSCDHESLILIVVLVCIIARRKVTETPDMRLRERETSASSVSWHRFDRIHSLYCCGTLHKMPAPRAVQMVKEDLRLPSQTRWRK